MKSGGAKFDVPTGRDIIVSQALLTELVTSGGGLTKSGTAKLILSGANTYTGNTTISAGTLELALGGSLKFAPKANGLTNKITGTATVSLKGSFNLDLGGAVPISVNSRTLVVVGTLAETYDASFALTGFTQASNIWTKTEATGQWTFTETSGVLSYTSTASFSSWISGYAVGAKNLPGDDFDNDSINNLLEYAFSGNPAVTNRSILPQLAVTSTHFEFTYSRSDLSLADTAQSFQYGGNLSGWTSIVIPAGPGVSGVGIATVTITNTGTTDSVKVSIPQSAAAAGKLVGRLKVVK